MLIQSVNAQNFNGHIATYGLNPAQKKSIDLISPYLEMLVKDKPCILHINGSQSKDAKVIAIDSNPPKYVNFSTQVKVATVPTAGATEESTVPAKLLNKALDVIKEHEKSKAYKKAQNTKENSFLNRFKNYVNNIIK